MIFTDINDFAIRDRPLTPNIVDLWVYVNGLRAVTNNKFSLRSMFRDGTPVNDPNP